MFRQPDPLAMVVGLAGRRPARKGGPPGPAGRGRGLAGRWLALGGLWLGVAMVTLAAPAASAAPARVRLETVAGREGALHLTAVVTDASGAPVAEQTVVFKARTAFGWLLVGERSTDAAGRATVDLPAGARLAEIRVEVGNDGEASATLRLRRSNLPAPQVRPGRDVLERLSPQPGFISPYPVPAQVALLAVVLGGIWTTYGYVAWLLWRIRRER